MKTNLADTLPQRRHWFPIERILPMLHSIELETCFTPGNLRKSSQVLQRSSQKFDGFDLNSHERTIQYFV